VDAMETRSLALDVKLASKFTFPMVKSDESRLNTMPKWPFKWPVVALTAKGSYDPLDRDS